MVMKKYILQRTCDGKYYKHSKHAGSRWVDAQKKAKVYNQLNHIKCAIANQREYADYYRRITSEHSWTIQKNAFRILVFEVEMIPKEVIEVE
jgi:hypothetical protein